MPRVRKHIPVAHDHGPAIVYVATNIINGKRYIGITRKTLARRQAQHLSRARDGRNDCGHFYAAIRKYGEAAFTFSIMEHGGSMQEAARAEIRLIAALKPEYNQSPGGDGIAGVGYRPSAASRQKMSESHVGKPGHWQGKKRSPDTIEKMRARLLANPINYWEGKKRSLETIEKIRITKASQPVSEEQKNCKTAWRKWVECLDDGLMYHGAQAAADAYGLRRDTVGAVCRGRAKSTGGLRFQYIESGDH